MSEEQRTLGAVSDLLQTAWLWILPLAGGVADYLIQMQRGQKPKAPPSVVIAAFSVHMALAMFAGILAAFVCGALGFQDELAYGAACGFGGYMGVRVFDLLPVIFAKRTGIELPPTEPKS